MCEMFFTCIYLINETGMVLCFQTSTILTVVWAEDWVLDHGLLLTLFFYQEYFVTMCQVSHLKFL